MPGKFIPTVKDPRLARKSTGEKLEDALIGLVGGTLKTVGDYHLHDKPLQDLRIKAEKEMQKKRVAAQVQIAEAKITSEEGRPEREMWSKLKEKAYLRQRELLRAYLGSDAQVSLAGAAGINKNLAQLTKRQWSNSTIAQQTGWAAQMHAANVKTRSALMADLRNLPKSETDRRARLGTELTKIEKEIDNFNKVGAAKIEAAAGISGGRTTSGSAMDWKTFNKLQKLQKKLLREASKLLKVAYEEEYNALGRDPRTGQMYKWFLTMDQALGYAEKQARREAFRKDVPSRMQQVEDAIDLSQNDLERLAANPTTALRDNKEEVRKSLEEEGHADPARRLHIDTTKMGDWATPDTKGLHGKGSFVSLRDAKLALRESSRRVQEAGSEIMALMGGEERRHVESSVDPKDLVDANISRGKNREALQRAISITKAKRGRPKVPKGKRKPSEDEMTESLKPTIALSWKDKFFAVQKLYEDGKITEKKLDSTLNDLMEEVDETTGTTAVRPGSKEDPLIEQAQSGPALLRTTGKPVRKTVGRPVRKEVDEILSPWPKHHEKGRGKGLGKALGAVVPTKTRAQSRLEEFRANPQNSWISTNDQRNEAISNADKHVEAKITEAIQVDEKKRKQMVEAVKTLNSIISGGSKQQELIDTFNKLLQKESFGAAMKAADFSKADEKELVNMYNAFKQFAGTGFGDITEQQRLFLFAKFGLGIVTKLGTEGYDTDALFPSIEDAKENLVGLAKYVSNQKAHTMVTVLEKYVSGLYKRSANPSKVALERAMVDPNVDPAVKYDIKEFMGAMVLKYQHRLINDEGILTEVMKKNAAGKLVPMADISDSGPPGSRLKAELQSDIEEFLNGARHGHVAWYRYRNKYLSTFAR